MNDEIIRIFVNPDELQKLYDADLIENRTVDGKMIPFLDIEDVDIAINMEHIVGQEFEEKIKNLTARFFEKNSEHFFKDLGKVKDRLKELEEKESCCCCCRCHK